MKITDEGIEFKPWHVVLIAVVVLSIVGAATAVALNGQKVAVQKIQAEQQEKTERGHWLWGHWDDVAEKKGEGADVRQLP